jgi:hypothetical protein
MGEAKTAKRAAAAWAAIEAAELADLVGTLNGLLARYQNAELTTREFAEELLADGWRHDAA